MKFTDTPHCMTRHHCAMCRDPGTIGTQFRETLRKHHEMPGPSLFDCPHGVTAATLPVPLTITRRQFLPTPEEQAGWLARAKPHCEGCPAFGGIEERSGMHIPRVIKCADCKTCGSKTVGPLQDCPRGLFERWRPPANE